MVVRIFCYIVGHIQTITYNRLHTESLIDADIYYHVWFNKITQFAWADNKVTIELIH